MIGTARHATAAGIAATLDADPQFSDFVTELKFAGLWPAMERATNVTVFAPTNRAFDKTGSGWRAEIQSEINFQANGRGFAWQQTLLGTVITGVHSTDEFTGKAQFVHSIGSTVYWVDGRTGAAIHVQDKAPAEIGIVATPKRAELSLPPIMTSSGLIYPMDTIIR
ncbi:MAG: fasciclin domain-containing protein [Acetobacteraceae bacterium]